MKTSITMFALLLSSLSLALQLKKTNPAPPFDKFLVPAKIFEFDFRVLRAQQNMIREAAFMSEGIGVPFISQLSDDHKRIIVRAMVSEKSLPKDHNERKNALMLKAYEAVGSIASEFGLSFDDKSAEHAVRVEFVSIEEMTKGKEVPKMNVYAELNDGELTFH